MRAVGHAAPSSVSWIALIICCGRADVEIDRSRALEQAVHVCVEADQPPLSSRRPSHRRRPARSPLRTPRPWPCRAERTAVHIDLYLLVARIGLVGLGAGLLGRHGFLPFRLHLTLSEVRSAVSKGGNAHLALLSRHPDARCARSLRMRLVSQTELSVAGEERPRAFLRRVLEDLVGRALFEDATIGQEDHPRGDL